MITTIDETEQLPLFPPESNGGGNGRINGHTNWNRPPPRRGGFATELARAKTTRRKALVQAERLMRMRTLGPATLRPRMAAIALCHQQACIAEHMILVLELL